GEPELDDDQQTAEAVGRCGVGVERVLTGEDRQVAGQVRDDEEQQQDAGQPVEQLFSDRRPRTKARRLHEGISPLAIAIIIAIHRREVIPRRRVVTCSCLTLPISADTSRRGASPRGPSVARALAPAPTCPARQAALTAIFFRWLAAVLGSVTV